MFPSRIRRSRSDASEPIFAGCRCDSVSSGSCVRVPTGRRWRSGVIEKVSHGRGVVGGEFSVAPMGWFVLRGKRSGGWRPRLGCGAPLGLGGCVWGGCGRFARWGEVSSGGHVSLAGEVSVAPKGRNNIAVGASPRRDATWEHKPRRGDTRRGARDGSESTIGKVSVSPWGWFVLRGGRGLAPPAKVCRPVGAGGIVSGAIKEGLRGRATRRRWGVQSRPVGAGWFVWGARGLAIPDRVWRSCGGWGFV